MNPRTIKVSIDKALAMYNTVRLMASRTQLLDIHTITAALLHRVPYSAVDKHQRNQAKALNYWWMYNPDARWSPPPRAELFAIYTPAEIKQLQVDLQWDGSEDLYDTIRRYFQPVELKPCN